MKIKVLYEYIKCDYCRKRARYWMDGVGICDDHRDKIQGFLRHMIRQIRYEVPR